MRKTDAVFILDGYSIIYRSYFAFIKNPLFNSKGENVSAYFGFFRTLFAIFQKYNPQNFIIALDSIGPTFRHEQYKEYKATREKTPEELKDQIPLIEEALNLMGIQQVRVSGVEADDIMATIARESEEKQQFCYIITGDKDLLQLASDYVTVLRPEKGEYLEMTSERILEKLSIKPSQVLDYLSLIGDSSDNVPGVKGIGEKTAVKLLHEFGTLDAVYDNLESIKGAVQKKLSDGKDSAYLSKQLISLKYDVTLPNIDASVNYEQLLHAVPHFEKHNAKSLIEQLYNFQDRDSLNTGELKIKPLQTEQYTKHYSLILDKTMWIEVKQQLLNSKVFAFDIETDNIDPMYAEPVGFSFSCKEGEAYYWPLIAQDKQYFDKDYMRNELNAVLNHENILYIGQNIKYDYKVLFRWGVNLALHKIFDTMIAAWLLDANANQYNMDSLALRYLNYETVHYKDIVPKGALFPDVPLETAMNYAAEDADITFRLYRLFSTELKNQNLDTLFQTVEMPLVKILADVEMEGFELNCDMLYEYETELKEKIDEIEKEVYVLCDKEFNLRSTKQLQEVLFIDRGLKPVKKTKTGYSTDTSVLEILAKQDEVPAFLLRHRMLTKLLTTYVEALPRLLNSNTKRLHTQFLVTGTATGRISSHDPNLQNIPIKDEEGRRIRSAFVAKKGSSLLSADYSQIELVVLAHLSEDENLIDAFKKGADIHRETAASIFSKSGEAVSSEERRIAKTINFGVMYGMSAFRLSRELNITMKAANEFISAYYGKYIRIREFIDKTNLDAEKNGYVKTFLGRKRQIFGIDSRNQTQRAAAQRIAVNTPIQGTAADIVKLAMLAVSKRLLDEGLKARMILQVHDELLFEVPDEELAIVRGLVESTMENVITLKLPLRVNIESGKNWGEFH